MNRPPSRRHEHSTLSDVVAQMQPPAKPRKRKAATLRDEDWEPHREKIVELYASGLSLDELKLAMEVDFDFFPEIRQYKSQFKKWGLGRNVTSREMKAIVRKRQQRKILEPSKPELVFTVRATEVHPDKIERWMDRHDVHESELYAPSPVASTPSAIDCHTPREPSTPSPPNDQVAPPVMCPDLFLELCSFMDDSIFCTLKNPSFPTTRKTDDEFIWALWFLFFSDHYKYQYVLEVIKLCEGLTECYLGGMISWSEQDMYRISHHASQPLSIFRGHTYNAFFIPCLLEHGLSDSLLEAVVRCWLTIGVDINHRSSTGLTPLLDACRSGSFRYVSLLVKYGADIHVVNSDGVGALTFARQRLDTPLFGHTVNNAQAIIQLLEAEAHVPYGRRALQDIENSTHARLCRIESFGKTVEGLMRQFSALLSDIASRKAKCRSTYCTRCISDTRDLWARPHQNTTVPSEAATRSLLSI